MKRIYIHIGYPKTATSVLQHNVFTKNHDNGTINYLGKRNADVGKKNNTASFIECMLDEQCVWSETLQIKSNLPNVISYEELTISLLNHERQNPHGAAKKLHKFFTDKYPDYKIFIIVTLRNQVDLIHSFYTEAYMWHFRHHLSVNTIDKYLEEGLNEVKNGMFLMYSYTLILSEYKNYFGVENIKILFYEDLVFDREFYIEELSSFLKIEENLISESFKSKINIKKSDLNGYHTHPYTISMFFSSDFPKSRNFLIRIARLLGEMRLIGKLYKYIDSKFGHIKLASGKKILFFNSEQSELIRHHFLDSNMKLGEDYNLDIDKMKKYGY